LNYQLFEYHPSIGVRFILGFQTRKGQGGGGFLLRTNQEGYRCYHEFVLEGRTETLRVLLFGDSYTAETGCGPAIASPRWPAACSGFVATAITSMLPALEVCNLGLPRSGTDQQYSSISEEKRRDDESRAKGPLPSPAVPWFVTAARLCAFATRS
jgi:carbamoyltransferase